MEAIKILQADILDILFEGKEKNYGAYELRKTYNQRITLALTGMCLLCLLFVAFNIFGGTGKIKQSGQMPVKDVSLSRLSDEEKKEAIKPPAPKPQPQQVATRKVTIPRIVPNEDVYPEDKSPTNDELDNVQIGIVNKDGINGDIVNPPVKQGTGNASIPVKEKDYEEKFIPVQYEAKFPGGTKAWARYLEINLNTNIPVENGAPVGQYTVVVSFSVDENGNVSNVQALNDPGYGMAAEAIKVITRSKQWIPAIQNGRNVSYRQKQSITFVVQES